jgi:uncharacterized RDD family membrane protein YckC
MAISPSAAITEGRQGHYAGAVSRLVAFGADVGISWGLYTLGLAALSFTVQLSTGHSYAIAHHQIPALIILAAWEFIYFAYQWSLNGKTIGMAILGIQVVRADGSPIGPKQAVIRTVTFPLSIIVIGLGFLGILVQRERRAWHDGFAGTCVIYSWDARAARLRWLAKKDHPVIAP